MRAHDILKIMSNYGKGDGKMTIQECYEQLGGDYSALKTRLPSDSLITKFITKFLGDKSFQELCLAMQEGQREEAFRAAHTLKGVCANLGFDRLTASASKLTELLRPEGSTIPVEASCLMDEVTRDYETTTDAIRAYLQ